MSDPNDTQPAPAPAAEGAAQTPAPAPTGAPAPQPSPHADNEVRMTQAQLDERLERGFKAMLSKQFGTNDPSQLQAMINEANDLKAKAEEQRKAEMSAVERAQAEKAELEQKMTALQQQHEDMVWQNDLRRECMSLGIKDYAYADYRIREAAARVGDDEDFDVTAFLKTDMVERAAAYGMVEQERVPASTVPTESAAAPSPDRSPSGDGLNADDLSPEELSKAIASWS